MSKKLRCVEDAGIVELAEGLKVISDPNRLRIICLLLRGERCVCEVERELEISQQLASHHLNVLKESGFLTSRREGTSSYYAVERGKLVALTRAFLDYLDYPEKSQFEEEAFCCGGSGEARPKPRNRGKREGARR